MSGQSGLVTFDVEDMTDLQVLFSAYFFKNMKKAPNANDINWKKLAQPLSMEPDFAKIYCETIRMGIKLAERRRKRYAKKGEKDPHVFKPTVNPLAPEEDDLNPCKCDPVVFEPTKEHLLADLTDISVKVNEMIAELQKEDEAQVEEEVAQTEEAKKEEEDLAEVVTLLGARLKL